MRDSKIAEKQPVIKEISDLLDGASSAVVVDYRGLTVVGHSDYFKRR